MAGLQRWGGGATVPTLLRALGDARPAVAIAAAAALDARGSAAIGAVPDLRRAAASGDAALAAPAKAALQQVEGGG